MGEPLDVLGSICVPMTISQNQFQHRFLFVRNIKHSIILGWDFLVANSALIDTSQSRLALDGVQVPFIREKKNVFQSHVMQ